MEGPINDTGTVHPLFPFNFSKGRSKVTNKLINTAVIFLLLHTVSRAQLSPGDLNRVHKHLEGLGQCTQCHEIGNKAFDAKCLSCHDLLGERVREKKGLHANPGYVDCSECHMDHLGRDFEMIHWPDGRDAFDHDLTGFSLVGRHRDRDCADCHNSRQMTAAARTKLKDHEKDLARTFLGLTATCSSCHQNVHGPAQEDCATCHQPEGWKPARGFDHDTAAFALVGAHSDLACDKCHARTEKGLVFQPLAFDTCLSCHADQHGPQLSRDCLTCHVMDGWRPPSRFDHARADFALTGAHIKTDCLACHDQQITLAGGHRTTRYTGLASGQCTDCHKDKHAGRFGDDCSSCHNTEAWGQYSRKRFDHGLTRYPLEGRHVKVACEACHKPGADPYTPAFDDCSDCHSDAHRGQLTAGVNRTGCEACHDVTGFTPALFSLERHDTTDFPLKGSHRAVPCFSCHDGGKAPRGQSSWRFHFDRADCLACHENPH
jgi:hypothetical protein